MIDAIFIRISTLILYIINYLYLEGNITMIDLVICCDEFRSYKDYGLIYYIRGSNKNGAFINFKEMEKPVNILYCPFCGESISQVME